MKTKSYWKLRPTEGLLASMLGVWLWTVSTPKTGLAATLRPTIVTGLMQQPSSQYYHYVYGGQLDIARKDDVAYMRLQYLERPAFESSGFIDQDFSAAVFFGKSVFKRSRLGISALVGAGQTWGYLKESKGDNPSREAYRMPGVGTAIEARWSSARVDVRASYQTMICQNDRDLFNYYVAWPFSWFLLSASMPVSLGGR